MSAKRKAAAKGEGVIEGSPPSLELVEDARHRHLEDLKREYGDNLRIAVDPETSFAAITGSHIRVRTHIEHSNVRLTCSQPPKLSPMVYSALQLITRGREDGITTVELGRKTRYDQKTCFYLIKQLVELGLMYAFLPSTGRSSNSVFQHQSTPRRSREPHMYPQIFCRTKSPLAADSGRSSKWRSHRYWQTCEAMQHCSPSYRSRRSITILF